MRKSLTPVMLTVGLASGVMVLSGTANAASASDGSNPPQVLSASYHMTANGNVAWTISLDNLIAGDYFNFEAGPTVSNVFPLNNSAGADIQFTASGTDETVSFVSQWPEDSDGNPVALLWVAAQELSPGQPPILEGVGDLSLNTIGVGQLPEAPWAAALPAVGLAVGLSTLWILRRHPRTVSPLGI